MVPCPIYFIAVLQGRLPSQQVILVSTEDTDAQGGWEARIVGTDSAHDLAVLKIDAPASALQPIKACYYLHLRPTSFPRIIWPVCVEQQSGCHACPHMNTVVEQVGTSADLKVGQSVFAIGNPFGLSRTLTAGVVSGLNRGIPTPGGAIATGAIQVSY